MRLPEAFARLSLARLQRRVSEHADGNRARPLTLVVVRVVRVVREATSVEKTTWTFLAGFRLPAQLYSPEQLNLNVQFIRLV